MQDAAVLSLKATRLRESAARVTSYGLPVAYEGEVAATSSQPVSPVASRLEYA